ncbi:AOC3-like protein [Mya arenaria]|uniref:Amine oxidase n=1 Tax=Mya arenaria TaxID=6604 RepID=A0ABY7E8Z1_MYAAR|nr:AOC3-like protein [Mya arenaria]
MEETNKYAVSSGSSDSGRMSGKQACRAQLFGVFLFVLGLVGGLLIGIYAYHGGKDLEVICKNLPESIQMTPTPATTARPNNQTSAATPRPTPAIGQCQHCHRPEPRQPWTGSHPELFAPLTADEMQAVYNFLVDNNYVHRRGLDEMVTLRTNYAPYMALYARVNVIRGDRMVPDYMEYKVGPLDRPDSITALALVQDGELTFNSRPYDYMETALYERIVTPDFKILEPLTKESFDGAYYPRENNDFAFWYFNGPPGDKGDERETRFIAYLNPLAPNGYDFLEHDFLPLSATIHCPGNVYEDWYIHSYYYLNQGPFANATALMEAYNAGTIRKFAHPKGYRNTILDRHLPDRDVDEPFRPKSRMPPPRAYEPEGPRYSIVGHTVSWMGWEFSATSGQLRGPALFDIKFKGESIAYEIALNEIGVVYGSGSAAQTNIIYTDSSYGIGEYYGIIKTVDCPEHSTLLETSHWDVYLSKPVVHKSICVYEADGQNALWRHKGYEFEGGLRNNFLVVRLSATIDNYDYIIEWHFYLDGKIYTIVSASGYIQGAFWDDQNPFMGTDKSRDSFGYRVNDFTHGQIHDHMFGFKVDLDIAGTNNTMEVVHWKTGDVVTALRSQVPSVNGIPPYFLNNITRYLEYEIIEREAAYSIEMSMPKFWTVVNENKRNKWGAMRGYHIQPLTTAAQTLTDAHPALPALSFTRHHCTVTKRKESEQYLSSTSDVNRLDKPIEHLEKMLEDNEYIRDTDIVNWVTVGFLHLPTSEDSPMTNRVESGFMLKPFNFFDKTAVFDLPAYLNTRGDWRTERPPPFSPCLEPEP